MVKSNKMRVLKFVIGFVVVLIMLGLSALPVLPQAMCQRIENTWATAQTQIKNVVNNVVFPAVYMILAIYSLLSCLWHIWTIESMDSLNSPHRQSCLRVLCFHLQRRCIFGRFFDIKKISSD